MKPIIRAQSLSKEYRIGLGRKPYSTVREMLMDAFRAPLNTAQRNGLSAGQTIWALKDVSFEVYPGEVIGIIGRNGAGKSTLLKLLSRISKPTTGRAELFGRVGSLLEIGMGFHPELTGRENIFLNGSILGMSRRHIERRFDEIVAFAEIDKLLDTPVKRYSSGMYVRLAFSVAVHLEPEILLIDEVLAVGDFAFQRKCLDKMRDVSANGLTVLVVSHNTGVISNLCQRCILLDQGRVIASGPTPQIMQLYMTSCIDQRAEYVQASSSDKGMNLRRVAIVAANDQIRGEIGYHESFRFVLEYEINHRQIDAIVGIGLFTVDGTFVFGSADFDAQPGLLGTRLPGNFRAEVSIPAQWLNVGKYSVSVYLSSKASGEMYDDVEALVFNIIDTGSPGSRTGEVRRGILQPILSWTTTSVSR